MDVLHLEGYLLGVIYSLDLVELSGKLGPMVVNTARVWKINTGAYLTPVSISFNASRPYLSFA